MKTQMILSIFVLSLFIVVSTVSPSNNNDIMEVDKIKIGMKGVCKTVFNGYKVENFDIEVIGVIENVFPKKNIILIKCSGNKIKETGVAAGMSGSPVYIDGKLIGALSYGWGFLKEAIAGVTPISDMLSIKEEPKDKKVPLPVDTDKKLPLKPLSGLLIVSGFDKSLFEELKKEMEKLDFFVQPFGGKSSSFVLDKNPNLEPGSAVGVNLIKGDLNVAAIGTLTYIKDKNIFAFGHRMLNLGNTDLPLTRAYIYGIFPSYEQSFKMGVPMEEIGRISFDMESGIAGEIGSFAKSILLKVTLVNEISKKSVIYNFQVIRNKMLSSKLLSIAIANTVSNFSKSIGENTVEVSINVKIAGLPELKFKDTYYSSTSPQIAVLQSVLPLLETLVNNDFSEIEFENVSAKINLSNRKKIAEIQSIYLSKNKVKPGEKVDVNVYLRKFEAGMETISIPVEIPFDVPEGIFSIVVCDALSSEMIDSVRIPRETSFGMMLRQPGIFLKTKPVSLRHLIELIEEKEKNTDIIVKLFMPFRKGVHVEGEEISSLPYSILQIIKSSNNTKYKEMFDSIYRKVYNTSYVITGNQRVNILVEKQ